MESRPFDAVLDPTFYSGGSRPQPAVLAQASSAAVVSGTNRYSHHHHFRPRMPHMNVIPPEVLLAPSVHADPSAPVENYSGSVDVSVQTVFRESEAQTDPYTPEVSIDPNKPTPEVLMLEGMTFSEGLPAGLAEVKMIELARIRHALEAALPPTTDEASVALRLGLLEKLEKDEFAARERDIDAFQEERLTALSTALAERDRANTFNAEVRVDLLKQDLLAQRDASLAKVAKKRLATLRKLDSARSKALPKRLMKVYDGSTRPQGARDLVKEMSNPGSSSFAPARSQGAAPGGNALRFDVEQVVLPPRSPEAVREFANNAPPHLRRAQIPQPRLAPELPARTPAARADKRMVVSLELAQQALERQQARAAKTKQLTGSNASALKSPSKQSTTGGTATSGALAGGGAELPSWFSKPTADRPVTPRVSDSSSDPAVCAAEKTAAALRLLQRLLRGRASQNAMFVGRAARAELITELRTAMAPRGDGGKKGAIEEAALDTMAGGRVAAILTESSTPAD